MLWSHLWNLSRYAEEEISELGFVSLLQETKLDFFHSVHFLRYGTKLCTGNWQLRLHCF